MTQILKWVETGQLRVARVTPFAFEALPAAHALIQSGKSVGKIVCAVDGAVGPAAAEPAAAEPVAEPAAAESAAEPAAPAFPLLPIAPRLEARAPRGLGLHAPWRSRTIGARPRTVSCDRCDPSDRPSGGVATRLTVQVAALRPFDHLGGIRGVADPADDPRGTRGGAATPRTIHVAPAAAS